MGSSATGYPGIVLMLPPKPHHEIIPPISSDPLHWTGTLAKPLEIPFDGAYWYFQIPDTRPSPDAHIQRGNPITKSIRSTNLTSHCDGSSPDFGIFDQHELLQSYATQFSERRQSGGKNCSRGLTKRYGREAILSRVAPELLVIPSSKAHFISTSNALLPMESMTFRFPP